MKQAEHFYFAYGSNLCASQMKERCPDSQPVGIGFLPGYALSFTRYSIKRRGGVADVVIATGSKVWGLVWQLSDSDLSSLDLFEGHPKAYQRNKKMIEMKDNRNLPAWVYEVTEKQKLILPTDEYIEIIKSESVALGFPPDYIAHINSFCKSAKR